MKTKKMKGPSVGIEAAHPVAIPSTNEDNVLTWLTPFVRHCGNPIRTPWHTECRRIRDYLLHAVREGEGVFIIDGVEHEVKSGDIVWIPPDVDHELSGLSSVMSCPYIHFDLIYRPGKSDRVIETTGDEKVYELPEYRALMHPPLPEGNPFSRLCGVIRTPLNDRIIEMMVAICNEAVRSQPFARWKTSGIMLELLAELVRGVQGVPESYMEHLPLLEKAVSYIHAHYQTKLKLTKVAGHCNISVNELRHLFNHHYECSPRTFLRHLRIEKAKEMLAEDENINITEVAYAVGFSSIYSFSRAFSDVEGVPPTAFRQFGTPHLHSETRQLLGRPAENN